MYEYKLQNAKILEIYSDTDWAKDRLTRKSVSCGVLQIGEATVYSYCRGQTVIALSSGEADFYGLSALSLKAIFVHNMLQELGYTKSGSTQIAAPESHSGREWERRNTLS